MPPVWSRSPLFSFVPSPQSTTAVNSSSSSASRITGSQRDRDAQPRLQRVRLRHNHRVVVDRHYLNRERGGLRCELAVAHCEFERILAGEILSRRVGHVGRVAAELPVLRLERDLIGECVQLAVQVIALAASSANRRILGGRCPAVLGDRRTEVALHVDVHRCRRALDQFAISRCGSRRWRGR